MTRYPYNAIKDVIDVGKATVLRHQRLNLVCTVR